MADAISLTLGEDEARSFAAGLKAYHAKEAKTGQNDGSNDTDMMQDNLELSSKGGEMADFRGLYGELDARKRLDLAALCILGMEEANTFGEAMRIAEDRNGPDLESFRQMPLAPEYILSGLDRASASGGDNVERLDRTH
ncbi:MAG: hypothetical protein V2I43_23355 [Parvularcula sp.]|jgi:hypothetical protein|nr:hypothetical protein [Parvularcula sp.]